MSGEPNLELDAILAEFHGEQRPAPPREEAQAPRRRERREAELLSREKPTDGTVVYTRREELLAQRPEQSSPAPQERPTQPRKQAAERQTPTAAQPQPQPRKQAPPPRAQQRQNPAAAPAAGKGQKNAAARRRKGRLGVALVLLLLAAALGGLFWWMQQEEPQEPVQEQELVSLDLGEAVEDYLAEARLKSRK